MKSKMILIFSLLLNIVFIAGLTGGKAMASNEPILGDRSFGNLDIDRSSDTRDAACPPDRMADASEGINIDDASGHMVSASANIAAQNGSAILRGFETGTFEGWEHGGALSQKIAKAKTHSGIYAVRLGSPSYDGCNNKVPIGGAWIRSTFEVPASGNPKLSLYYRMYSTDAGWTGAGEPWDTFDVIVDGSVLFTDGNPSNTNLDCNKWWDSGWRRAVISLRDYRGKTVTIKLRNRNKGDGWHNTYTFVDDVMVNETIGWMAIQPGEGEWSEHSYQAATSPDAVTHDWLSLNFSIGNFTVPPRFIASLATFDGGDSAHLRYQNLTSSAVEVKVEEDTNQDSEVNHTTEQISYLALEGDGSLMAVVGEVGQVSVSHVPLVVQLRNSYNDPVVFAQPASAQGAETVIARVSDVQADRFTIFIQEAPNLNGQHVAETVSYLVLEAGTWQLPNGSKLEVGKTTTFAAVGEGFTNTWATVDFATDFEQDPVIISQVQTVNGPLPLWLKTRQTNSSPTGFEVALQGEDMAHEASASSVVGEDELPLRSLQAEGLPIVR